MNDDRRIITPQEFAGRQARRASMAELNKLFAQRIKYLEDLNSRQAANIKAMNQYLTQLALVCGTTVPGSQAAGVNAADELLARIRALVEMENRQEPDLK